MKRKSKWKRKVEKLTPTIEVESIAVNDSGMHNTIVTVNHEWVYRFPKYKEELERTAKEYHVLKALKHYISLPIPYPEYANLQGCNIKDAFMMYRLIPGKPLFKQSFLQVEDHEKLAMQLGTFLKELHSVPVDQFAALNIENADSRHKWMQFYESVRSKLYPLMRVEVREQFEKMFDVFFNEPCNFHFEKCLVHGDFGPTNILHEGGNISGILDFSEVAIDDPALDIASLIGKFGYGEGFAKLIEKVYPQAGAYLSRASFYRSTFALQDALLGYDMKNEEILELGMQDYSK